MQKLTSPLSRIFRILIPLFGLALDAGAQALPKLIPFTDGGLWGYADTTGAVKIRPQYASAQFFSGETAVVTVPGVGKGFGLIDANDRFIIPPEAGWLGLRYNRWADATMNAVSGSGRYGILATDGSYFVKPEWEKVEAMPFLKPDSLKLVVRDGLYGIIDRAGNLVVPCKWGGISTLPALEEIEAYLVSDPDNVAGVNKLGLANLHGDLLIPPRYSGFIPERRRDGRLVIRATRSASNDQAQYSWNNNTESETRYLDPRTGTRIPKPDSLSGVEPWHYDTKTPGGYILRDARMLLDSNGKLLVSASSLRLRGDTVVMTEFPPPGKDSTRVRIQYRILGITDTAGWQREWYIYREPFRSYTPAPCGNANRYPREPAMTIPIPDYGEVERFYKDSLVYAPVRARCRSCFIVQGNSLGEYNYRSTVVAVVDSNIDYLLPPGSNQNIVWYDAFRELGVVQKYGTGMPGETLVTRDGRKLMQLRKGTIKDGFIWNGTTYAVIQIQDECNPDPTGLQTFITDHTATPLAALSRFRLADFHEYLAEKTGGRIWVRDSAQRKGLVFPDGSSVYPALNFRYTELRRSYNGWFMAWNGPAAAKLVDSNNRELVPGLKVSGISPATIQYAFSTDRQTATIPHLYQITGTDGKGVTHNFYIDRYGRHYTSAL